MNEVDLGVPLEERLVDVRRRAQPPDDRRRPAAEDRRRSRPVAGRGRSGAKSAGLRPMTRASPPAARARSVIVSSEPTRPTPVAPGPDRRQSPYVTPRAPRENAAHVISRRSAARPAGAPSVINQPLSRAAERMPSSASASCAGVRDGTRPGSGRHHCAVVIDDRRHQPVVLTGRLAEKIPEDRRGAGRTAREACRAGRCRAGEQRQMVPSRERDECGAIGRRDRCRPRVGAERRFQPLAKAPLGMRTQAEAVRQIAAKVDRRATPSGLRRVAATAATYASTSARTPG